MTTLALCKLPNLFFNISPPLANLGSTLLASLSAPGAKCTKVRIEQVKEQFADSAQGIPKDATPSSIKIYLSRIELADLLPNYKPKTAPVKPPIRPPINFDIPAPGPYTSPSAAAAAAAAAAEREKAARLRKPKEEGGSGGGFLGFGRR